VNSKNCEAPLYALFCSRKLKCPYAVKLPENIRDYIDCLIIKGLLKEERDVHAHKNVNITNIAKEYETAECECHRLIIYLLTVTQK
jgi:hypothetical protein